jgi:prepilin-type processing-associated H-X9-DG protein
MMQCPSDSQPDQITVPISGHLDATIATGNYIGSKGVLSAISHVRFADITDGLSQTLFVGERVFHSSVDGSLAFTSSWCGIVSETDVYVFTSTPYAMPLASQPLNRAAGPGAFSSPHTGGVQFVFGDGAVRFLSENMDGQVFQAMGTRSGGEVFDF